MRAAFFRQNGGPEVIEYGDFPDPEVGPNDVLVNVRAAALNHLDLFVRQGLPAPKIPMPHISGCEGAGDVVNTGNCVLRIKAGDAVIITPGWACNRCEFCLRGQESMCLSYGMLGVKRNGCFAEYVSVPEETLYPLPANLTYEQAASIPLVFLTAWHMLVSRAELKAGEDVLIQAGGSGVGIAGIQVAKLIGARIFTTASSQEKLDRAKELGAHILINYSESNFADEIRKITGKRGVDVIFEHTGEVNWERSIHALSRNGRLVMCGATSGHDARIDLRQIFGRQLSIIGSYMGSKRDLHDVLRFVNDGKLRPVIDSVFPLHELRAAEKKMQDRNVFGKIVIVP